ncbi:autophagy-related protein 2 homolog B [Trichonephila inaurata madagascariensis]|uniref:Autophagy-related protein 2 n=1 Tax=Trichonephila inaurata madagascariensis TaxID=2747483 RepID=A0A8X6YSU9_9ARAC|nr:autophagy-related protein 2 homolog B [Trichonephila inaurata madagascariensis]GFY75858.1 autophagy-related protein 2 homolog B [Trichonephila inaurata madagascariensis]
MKWPLTNLDLVLKRIFRYLVKIYLGQYLEEYSQDKLSYGFSYGSGSAENIVFNIEALNAKSEEYKLPVEFLSCTIDFMSICVPWLNFATKNSVVEIKGLKIVVQPKERPDAESDLASSMFDSIMTSSYQLAEECINSKTDDDEECEDFNWPAEGTGGVSSVAGLINTFFANLQVKFIDTSLKIEHVPGAGSSGMAFEIKIASAEYFDEAGKNPPMSNSNIDNDKSYEPEDYSNKGFIIEGMSMYTSQFSAQSRILPMKMDSYLESSQFVPGSPEMPPTHSSFPVKKVEPDFSEDPILVSKFVGKQEIRLKLKQKQTISGPKIDVVFSLGAFNFFLIPQQVHLLYELFSEVLKPGSNGNANRKLPLTVANKPMRPADYALVEQELLRQQQKSDIPSKSLKNQHGWSSHSLDESDEEFQLMTMHNKLASDMPITSNDGDSMCSSISSDTRSDYTAPCGRQSKSRGSTVQAMLQDQMSDVMHFQGSFSSLCIIVLHDDSVQESLTKSSADTSKSTSKKCFSLKERAETFFSDLHALQMGGLDFTDFTSIRQSLSELCPTNHLRLLASSISLDGSQRSSSAQSILDFTLSLSKVQVLECLFNSVNKMLAQTYVPILLCDQLLNIEDNDLSEVCFKLKYQQIEYTTQSRHIKPPANRLDIQFGPISCEIDISLTERIQTLLNFQNSTSHLDGKSDWKDSDISRSSSKTDVTISSPDLTINLRFPIPDLRSAHDMDRVPWWQQNLHPESLILETKGITLMTTIDGDGLQSKYEIQCRDVHGLFKRSEEEEPISFLRVSVDPDVDEISQNNGFGLPRLVIHQTTKVLGGDLETGLEEQDELFSCSLTDALISNMDTKPSPFCSHSVIYGSKLRNKNNSPDKEGGKETLTDYEEVIKPADKETIHQFIEQTISKSEYLYEFSFPNVNMVFPSKEFFELLYNRLGNDLLLWQRTELTPKTVYDPNGFKVHVPGLEFNSITMKDLGSESYRIFKPFANDSNSDSEEDVNYYSFSELSLRQNPKKKKKNDNSNAFTKISITIAITKGNLAIHVPIMDSSNEVIPDVCGKLLLNVEEGQIFVASSYKGDENTSYFCILAEKSTLFHNGLLKTGKLPTVEPLNRNQPKDVQCIIYKSEQGMRLKTSTCEAFKEGDMLKIAVHVIHSPKQQLKSFKVAIDISDATLRHYMHPSSQMWINQLMDFLKVHDFPVSGYKPSAVVTEFHLNLSNCAIDYRPVKLPLLSMVTVENFNMSCNISATTPSFLFRLISDEMRLFISNEVTMKKPDIKKNYVCVVDSGFIDVSIRTGVDDKNEAKLELCAINNSICVRTCADSLKAMIDLLIYVSASGDMETCPTEDSKENQKSKSSTVKDEDSENLHLLMAEAMKDFPKDFHSGQNGGDSDKTSEAFSIINMDDEFCILEDDPGVGLMPRNGEPQVRILTDGPIKIIEDHFSVPPGKSDVLKAPKHFPKPIVLLTLREMSLDWHLYGGNDFKVPGKKKSKNKKKDATVSFNDLQSIDVDTNNSNVTFCKVTNLTNSNAVKYSTEQVTIEQTKEHSLDSFLSLGGANRDQNVLMKLVLNKVKFQREVYPEDNEYASRYILLVNDVEIIDRLKSSNFNKFLYQYSSKQIPRQSSANMIEIKAVYSRPDPNCVSEECSLYVSCKPIRLNIDQDSLIFLINFFQEVFGASPEENEEERDSNAKVNAAASQVKNMPLSQHNASRSSETFYRVFSFSPDVLIRIDYQGKHVLMEQGALKGLLMGLGQLNTSEITLKRLCYRHGLLGHHKILSYATNEWKQDIFKNQLPSILGGVGPMHSFVQLFQGVKDFVCFPVAQYKRDGQIVRGLQRGASSLSTSAVMAFLDLASGLVYTIQSVAIIGYDMVSPGPSKFQKPKETFRQITQPADVREGLTSAANVVKVGMTDVSRDMYIAASAEHEHKGVPGAIGGVLRQIPKALIKPVIVGTEATNYVIDGVRHQLMPDAHQEDIHKWRTKNC